MNYTITFRYMDGEDFQIDIHPEDMEPFMASLGKGEVYFNSDRGVGVWIPVDKIRYFSVETVDENGNRVLEPKKELVSEEIVTEEVDDGC